MKYDLTKFEDKASAKEYFNRLIEQGARIEIIKKNPKRSLQHNAYLHVLFSMYGLELGYTLEEAKTLIKRELGYFYEKNGVKFLVKTSGMDSKELSDFINKFRNLSSKQGYYLPEPHEITDSLTNYIESQKQYL